MDLILMIYLNAFALGVCLLLLGSTKTSGMRGRMSGGRVLAAMLYVNIATIGVDVLLYLVDGRQGDGLAVLNGLFNFIYYLLIVAVPFLYSIYVDLQLCAGRKKTDSIIRRCSIQLVPLLLLALTNPVTKALYFFDVDNRYHPGRLLPLFSILGDMMMLYLLVKMIINIRRINRQKLLMLTAIFILFFSASAFQLITPSVSVVPLASTLAMLMILIREQCSTIDTDYLTGIFNRVQSDEHMREKIRRSTAERTFSGIMIDLDNFKDINDRFGHVVGDDALETAARLLKSSIHRNDFVARVGGDEFLIILSIDLLRDLKRVADRIERVFEKFNESGKKSYRLSLSMGYDVYDFHKHMSKEQFLKHIDRLMYVNKKIKKDAGLKLKETEEALQQG